MGDLIERSGWKMDKKKSENNKNYKPKEHTKSNFDKPTDNFWKEYLHSDNKYFLDEEKKQLDVKYVDDYAETLANKFKMGKVKITQIRGFFNTVVKLNRKMNGNQMENHDFLEIKADLGMLKSYAENKKENGYVSDDFVRFIKKNINSINDEKDLNAFRKHFEAIICYMPKDR